MQLSLFAAITEYKYFCEVNPIYKSEPSYSLHTLMVGYFSSLFWIYVCVAFETGLQDVQQYVAHSIRICPRTDTLCSSSSLYLHQNDTICLSVNGVGHASVTDSTVVDDLRPTPECCLTGGANIRTTGVHGHPVLNSDRLHVPVENVTVQANSEPPRISVNCYSADPFTTDVNECAAAGSRQLPVKRDNAQAFARVEATIPSRRSCNANMCSSLIKSTNY